jgi:hypothetical protein
LGLWVLGQVLVLGQVDDFFVLHEALGFWLYAQQGFLLKVF